MGSTFDSVIDDSILAPSFGVRASPKYAQGPSLSTAFASDPQHSAATTNTFVPPVVSVMDSKAFKDPPPDKTRVVELTLDDLKAEVDEDSLKRRWFAVAGFIAIVVGMVVAVGVAVSVAASEGAEDFCADFGISDDEVRRLLADNFDTANTENELEVDYRDVEAFSLPCLPPKAFSLLSAGQVSSFQSAITLQLQDVGLEKVASNSFGAEVNNIAFLELLQNSLAELPDQVFATFDLLRQVTFNENDFKTLNNNLFAEANIVETLIFDACLELEEFPEVIQFTPNLLDVRVNNAPLLEVVNVGIFENLNLTRIEIINTALASEGALAFAELVGVDEAIVVVD